MHRIFERHAKGEALPLRRIPFVEMFIRQAALQFFLLTNKQYEAPTDVMQAELKRAIGAERR